MRGGTGNQYTGPKEGCSSAIATREWLREWKVWAVTTCKGVNGGLTVRQCNLSAVGYHVLRQRTGEQAEDKFPGQKKRGKMRLYQLFEGRDCAISELPMPHWAGN
jgi:hypothetical protein